MSTPLRQARLARGWTQREVTDRLITIAEARGQRTPGLVAPIIRCLSQWERGLRVVSATYRELFCELYEATPAELGLTTVWTHNHPVITRVEIAAGTVPTRLRTSPPDPFATGDGSRGSEPVPASTEPVPAQVGRTRGLQDLEVA